MLASRASIWPRDSLWRSTTALRSLRPMRRKIVLTDVDAECGNGCSGLARAYSLLKVHPAQSGDGERGRTIPLG
jgi:hypothetical protein